MSASTESQPLLIGGLIFEGLDQADFTGPFEVLSRLPCAQFEVVAKTAAPVRDMRGLILTPSLTFEKSPAFDVLLVPGGAGVNTLMKDEVTLDFLRRQARGVKILLSVCTGALLCGAAGLLQGRRATTHWASRGFLPSFGASVSNERVTIDGRFVTAAGVTSGIDAALRVAALLCGEHVAQEIQLYMEYAPEPPFSSGTPETAPPSVHEAVKNSLRRTVEERQAIIHQLTQT